MQLPSDRMALSALTEEALRQAILERRLAIRHDRDQRLDDRCWVDHYGVWMMVSGLVLAPIVPFNYDKVIERCKEFYRCCRADQPDPMPHDAIVDPAHWDDDLATMSQVQFLDTLCALQQDITTHYAAYHRPGRPGTLEDDRALYATTLPEKLPADFRLPPEDHFLGETKAPDAGCPAFWRSHDGCDPRRCDPTKWGPCP